MPSEKALKVALICSKKVYTPLSKSSLDLLIEKFAKRERISTKLLRDIFSSESISPSAFRSSFISGVKEFLLQGFLDGRIRAQDRSMYLLLLANVVEAEEKNSQEWYDHYYQCGNFLMLNFFDAIIWDRCSAMNRAMSLVTSDDALIDYKILRRYLLAKPSPHNAADRYKRLIELYVPDFGNIPWPAIFELRQDKRVNSFQEHLDTLIVSTDELSAAKRAIDEVCNAVSEVSPNITTTALTGILSNVPLPMPVNPLSLGQSLLALVRAIKWRKTNKWLTFIQGLRGHSSKAKSKTLLDSNEPFLGPEGLEQVKDGYLWLTNYPSPEFVKEHLHDRAIEAKGRIYRLSFRSDESIDIFYKGGSSK